MNQNLRDEVIKQIRAGSVAKIGDCRDSGSGWSIDIGNESLTGYPSRKSAERELAMIRAAAVDRHVSK